ncbi:MAG: transporter substrate-binding domain-containing protein [Methylobacter sp.]|nr:transporter substrate-binding domain-containing protein [Methylobacter sp.]
MAIKEKFNNLVTFDEILNRFSIGKTDIAAAGLTITDQRKKQIRFAPAYMKRQNISFTGQEPIAQPIPAA